MGRRAVICSVWRFESRQLLLGDGWMARRLELFRILRDGGTVKSAGKSYYGMWMTCRNYLQLGGNMWFNLRLT